MPAPDSLHGAQQFSSRHQPCPLPFSPDQSGPHGPCLRNPDYLAFQPYLVLPLTFAGRWKRRVLARVASSLPASVWVRAAPFLLCGGRWSWPGALGFPGDHRDLLCLWPVPFRLLLSRVWKQVYIFKERAGSLDSCSASDTPFFSSQPSFKRMSTSYCV